MASICSDKGGHKRILFFDGDGNRKVLRLGKASRKQAESFKVKLESLLTAKQTGGLDDEVARWLAQIGDDLQAKLANLGLVESRMSLRLGEFIDQYIKVRDDVKATTATTYAQARRHLITFFGADKPLRGISEGDADLWRLHLIREGLADASVRKFCGIAKQFFRMAVRRKLVASNPFIDLESSARGNKQREYFVSRKEAEEVLDACIDDEWRLLFALCRFGGLRCPSEVLALRWQDINWERGRILVHSPKTEHHEGGESRLVPLFPELLPYLREVFENAEPGVTYCITRYRRPNCNLRTQLHRIIQRAGLVPWPRTFQNLRSTCETELCETFPLHVVTAWIGNSQLVAKRHYLQVTDEHFDRAAQIAAHSPTEAQKAAQHPATLSRTESQPNPDGSPENADLLVSANCCKSLQDKGMGDEGIEPSTAALRVRCSTN